MLSKSPVSSKDSKRSKDSKDKKSSKDQDENEKNKDEAEDFTIFKCNKSAFLEDMVNSNEEYVLKKKCEKKKMLILLHFHYKIII